jgi:outer membrane lipoprotein-sorting protein
MKKIATIALILFAFSSMAQPTATVILEKMDKNMSSENRVFESEMIIYGKRNSRTITSKTYSVGFEKSFTEYLSPAREQGTKMLKLENQLWIYSPSTDRTVQIAGHMLRQSVMGSDLSYEDMMEDRKLSDIYNAKIIGEELIDKQKVWVLELTAKTDDIAYAKRKIWVHQEKYVPLKEEMYAKSGRLLKQAVMSDIVKVEGRWFPKTVKYKDMMKEGNGTIFTIKSISFNTEIPEYIFSKAALKK